MTGAANRSTVIGSLSFLYLCFIISGAVGLIYEIVCASLISQLIGGASSTHAAVLAFFMAGLAIGNRFGGKWADRLGAPWLFYALIEATIGLLVILALFVADLTGLIYVTLAPSPFSDYSWLDSGLRWTLAAIVMMPAAIMMGSTLPILVRVTTSSLGDLGRAVGWLYFINSIGAVCGALLAGFILLPQFGLEQSVIGAGLTNLVLALFIYLVGRFVRREKWNQEPLPIKRQDDIGRQYSTAQGRCALGAIFLSGLASTSLEVAWTRTLSLTLGGTAPAFSLMLATFIGGIAFGGLFASWLTRGDRDAYKPLLWVLSGGMLALLFSVPFYDRLPFLFHEFGHSIPKTKEHFGDFVQISALLAIGVMALPTLALGAALPMASRVITRSLGHAGQSVGRVFSVNTTGNVIGALSAGIFVLPALGLEGLFSVILLLLAASLALASALPNYRHWWSVSVIVIVGTLISPSWDPLHKMSGLYRFLNQDIGGVEGFRELTAGTKAIFDADDAEMAVGVVQRPDGHRILRVNGKTDGGTHGDVPTQILVGQLPAIYHGNPETVLVVGMGTGMTVGSLLAHESIRQIDVVEISPRIVEASKLFDTWTGAPHLDPRVRVHTRDARNFLRILPDSTRYDVIISQPSNPWQPGSAALFTVEYFEQVKERLSPNGIFSQWLETYDLSQETIELIMKTYSQVFPNSRMFNAVGYDFIILSADRTPSLDVPAATARMHRPLLRTELQRLRTDQKPFTPTNLLTHETLGPKDFTRLWNASGSADSRELHTDRFPRIQYMAASDFFVGLPTDFLDHLDGRRGAQKDSDMGLADLYRGRSLSTREAQELIDYWRQRPRAVGSKFDQELVDAYDRDNASSRAAPPKPDRASCLEAIRLDSARLQDGATVLTEPSLAPSTTLLLRCNDYLTDEEVRKHESLAESLRITNSS